MCSNSPPGVHAPNSRLEYPLYRICESSKLIVMRIWNGRTDDNLPRGGVLAVGNFDGVHRGHQEMIARLRRAADDLGAPSVVLTFDPSPAEVLRPELAPPRLTTLERRVELLERLGVEQILVVPPDRELLSWEWTTFCDRLLEDSLAIRGIVEGRNFCFGRNRQGTIERLAEWCAAHQRRLDVVDPVTQGDAWVSSSQIRELLRNGDVSAAAKLLGRPHRLSGVVERGAGRGTGIGFPTANLARIGEMIPLVGVYAGVCRIGGRHVPAALNIGPNPTFAESDLKVEVHLLDFAGDLYGQTLAVDLLERIRGTHRFDSLAALQDQLQRDIQATRNRATQPIERNPAEPDDR